MSDLSIPGVSSRFNTDKMIEDLMKVERIPLQRLEDSLKKLKSQQSTWRDMNALLSKLRDSARGLFSFQNPFAERTAQSGNETSLTATASREAIEGSTELRVMQVASADRLSSRSLPQDFRVEAGAYTFRVGSESVTVNFRGGTLDSFARELGERSRGLLRAQVVKNSATSQVLVIESTKTGAANTLSFADAAESFALSSGIIERSPTARRDISLAQAVAWEKPFTGTQSAGVMTLRPGAEARLPITPPVPAEGSMVLEIEVRLRPLGAPPAEEGPPPGPATPPAGSVTLGDVTVQNSPSQAALPVWTPPPKPPVVDDFSLLYAGFGAAPIALPQLSEGSDFVTIRVPLKDYGGNLQEVMFRNRNTGRQLEVRAVRVLDPEARGEFRPANPLAVARDARLTINGVEVTRPSNTIGDLITGTTLTLKAPSEQPFNLSITPDHERIKDAVIEFVGLYNQSLTWINILTRNEPALISEATFLTPEDKTKAQEAMGSLAGDMALSQMKTSMQTFMMNAYRTSGGDAMALLAQIGISTNTRAGAGVDVTKLRGYLEMDEGRFDKALGENLQAVKELFAFDTDGDLVADTGVAFILDSYLRPFVQSGGIISNRIGTFDQQISRTTRDISTMQQKLERTEADLRQKYGQMEGALNSLEKSSSAIENFNRSQSGTR